VGNKEDPDWGIARGLVQVSTIAYVAKMPVCVACGEWGCGPLCLRCRRRLRPGDSGAFSGVAVDYALHHSGTGRLLVHRLKYHGLTGAADVLAAVMAPLVAGDVDMLVAVPRATARRIAYGVDPAKELARRVGRLVGLPVVAALAPPLWWPRHATRDPLQRASPSFSRRRRVGGNVVLIDDVVTSGATLRGAAAALGVEKLSAVTATSPGMMVASKAPLASRRLCDGQASWQGPVDKRPETVV